MRLSLWTALGLVLLPGLAHADLKPIKSYSVDEAWSAGSDLAGQRIRIKDWAEVKQTRRGAYVVLERSNRKRIGNVPVKDNDVLIKMDLGLGKSCYDKINLEATARGVKDGCLVLKDAELLPLDAPEADAFVADQERRPRPNRAGSIDSGERQARAAYWLALNQANEAAFAGNLAAESYANVMAARASLLRGGAGPWFPGHAWLPLRGPVPVSGYYNRFGHWVNPYWRHYPRW